MKAPEGMWEVSYGIHDGTLMSRDSGSPTFHDSSQAARKAFADAKRSYTSLGYRTWFAHMYDEKGLMTELDAPAPYR
jgi:hypothetical protein